MAKKASSKRKSKATNLTVRHGDVTFQVEKSVNQFAVKKRVGAKFGVLQAARDNATTFPQLSLNTESSTRDIEVYSVETGSLDAAMDRLRQANNDVEWCGHVYHTPGDSQGLMVPKESIYVELAADADTDAVNALLDKHGLEFVSQDQDNPRAVVLRLTSAATENPIKIANALLETDEVTVAEPDFATAVSFKAHRPMDSLFADQWHLENRGGFALTAGADVSAPDAWDITRGDRSLVVCVMDDGVDIDHIDFSSPGKIVAPRDFGQDDSDPSPVRNGRGHLGDNHGTACAGVAVADENGLGVVGIAPNCSLMPVRTSGMISNETIKNLFEYAQLNGADVISCSWGVARKFFPLTTPMKNSIAKAAREGRGGKGCVILFAAGNEDSPVDGVDKDGDPVLAGFAKHPDVMAIAASTSNDVRSHYSNFGPEIWVSAPSSGSGGRGILTTDRSGDVGYEVGDYTVDDPFGGTSSATPLAAGVCGLILSVNPGLSAEEVREILKETADKIDQDGGNYDAQGHSDLYGYGRVNAHRGVLEARNRLVPHLVRTRVFERAPALTIPDDHPVGVSDTIHVDDAATVESVTVSLEIDHTYRGDLEVSLIGPDTTSASLHDRSGTGQDNLRQTYDLANRPGLSQLTGMAARGSWTLQVRDLAAVDTGTLKRWTLSLGLSGGPRTEWETNPGLQIPDNDPQGVVSPLEVDGVGELRAIDVTLDITHTYRGDLLVDLIAPGGQSITVHNRTGRSEDHLQRTYRVADTPALSALVDSGVEINGTWQLRVADRAKIDTGKLNGWKLKLLT